MDDVSSFSHRQLSTILKDPQHPHHAAAKAERDRRNMQNEVSDQMKARYIRQADQSHRAARSNEREAIRANNPEKAKKYRDIMNKRNAGMTKAFGEAFGRANFTQQLKKKGIDVNKMHSDNVKDAAAAKKRAAAASKDLTDFRKKNGMTSESKDEFEPHMMYDPKTGKGYMAKKPADHDRMNKMGYTHDKPKVNEVSAKTLSNYMRKSAADAGKPRQSARTQDKRIGGQKMADDKLRKMDGKGSAAKVAATNEEVELDEDRRTELHHQSMMFTHAMKQAEFKKKDPRLAKQHDVAGKLHAKAADMHVDNHSDAKKHSDKANKASKLLGEEVELVSEISMGKMQAYGKAAAKDIDQKRNKVKAALDQPASVKHAKAGMKAMQGLTKRSRGSDMYVNKMTGRSKVKPTLETIKKMIKND